MHKQEIKNMPVQKQILPGLFILHKWHLFLISFLLSVMPAIGIAGQSIIVQSTTSTQNSGLFDFILPRF